MSILALYHGQLPGTLNYEEPDPACPVTVHTGGVCGLSLLIRRGWVQAILSGNALGVHDIEAALLGVTAAKRGR